MFSPTSAFVRMVGVLGGERGLDAFGQDPTLVAWYTTFSARPAMRLTRFPR